MNRPTVIPTRPTFAPKRWLLRWYLDFRRRSVERDIEGLTQQRELDARQIELYESVAAHLRASVALLD